MGGQKVSYTNRIWNEMKSATFYRDVLSEVRGSPGRGRTLEGGEIEN